MLRKVKIPQPYASVEALQKRFNILLPRKSPDWRLIKEPPVGEINGIPSMRGIAMATDGILAIIVHEETVIFGHVDYFMVDKEEFEPPRAKKKTLRQKLDEEKKPSRVSEDIWEFA